MNMENYQKKLEKIIEYTERDEEGQLPHLFLHSCCAPCSSYVLEYLSKYFDITLFYYNPNIAPMEEYRARVTEQRRLCEQLPTEHSVIFKEGKYDPERYYKLVSGLEKEPEGGSRCEVCFRLRLEETAILAAKGEYDYFTTTLSISPLKNAQLLGRICYELEGKYGVKWLPSDFKKKEGYKRSIELSREYNLYRQNYCGCAFSKRDDI